MKFYKNSTVHYLALSHIWVGYLRKSNPKPGNVIYYVQEYKNPKIRKPKITKIPIQFFSKTKYQKFFAIPPLHMLSCTGSLDLGRPRVVFFLIDNWWWAYQLKTFIFGFQGNFKLWGKLYIAIIFSHCQKLSFRFSSVRIHFDRSSEK